MCLTALHFLIVLHLYVYLLYALYVLIMYLLDISPALREMWSKFGLGVYQIWPCTVVIFTIDTIIS